MNVIKRDSSWPYLHFAIQDDNESPVSASAYVIRFIATNEDGTVVIDTVIGEVGSPAVWDDEAGGLGHYEWEDGDTASVGVYKFEFKCTRKSDGKEFQIPKRGFYSYRVVENIAVPPT